MTAVAQKCGEFLGKSLNPECCLQVRSTNGVLNDPMLLNSVDNYIKENISEVIKCKFVEKLDKIKIEVLQNSDEEIDSVNPRNLFALIIDWIRKEFDENRLTNDELLLKTYMLYLNTNTRSLHDCLDIENNDHHYYSEIVHEYKSLSRKLSATKKSTENVNLNANANGNQANNNTAKDQNLTDSSSSLANSQANSQSNLNELIKDANNNKNSSSKMIAPIPTKTSKPKQFLFTRSDSDSSLSSVADDDENDWKVLGININGNKNNINGLVMVAGKLYLCYVKLKIHSPNATRNNSLDKSEIYSTIAFMNDVRCALGSVCLNGKLVVCGGYNKLDVLKTVEMYDDSTNKWTYLEPMKVARARFSVTILDAENENSSKIFAVGGSDGTKELCSSEVYDSKKNVWNFIRACPIERSNSGVCALNGLVYVIGGWNSSHSNKGLQRCDTYDSKTDEWKRIADLKIGRYQVSVTVLNGHIYAVGMQYIISRF